MTPEQWHAVIAAIPFIAFTAHVTLDNAIAGARFIRSLTK